MPPFISTLLSSLSSLSLHHHPQHPGKIYMIGGDYDGQGPISNEIFESQSGIFCNYVGVPCNGQGTCGNGTQGCIDCQGGYQGDVCQIPPPPPAESSAWRATSSWLVVGAVLVVQWVVVELS